MYLIYFFLLRVIILIFKDLDFDYDYELMIMKVKLVIIVDDNEVRVSDLIEDGLSYLM